jgi:hypothetical protein
VWKVTFKPYQPKKHPQKRKVFSNSNTGAKHLVNLITGGTTKNKNTTALQKSKYNLTASNDKGKA